jgi:hypothetical protein
MRLPECHRNPGQLTADPNCINASKFAGRGLFKGNQIPPF